MASGSSGDDPDGAGGSGGDPPAGDDQRTGGEDRAASDGDDGRLTSGWDDDLGDPDEPGGSAEEGSPEDGAGEDGARWRFGLDDVDEDGIVRSNIEPGDPDVENVAFVILGAIAMVLVFVRLWLLVS